MVKLVLFVAEVFAVSIVLEDDASLYSYVVFKRGLIDGD